MTYRDAISAQMQAFSHDPLARFIGYGLLNGKGACGTMKSIANDKIVETTVAENMMVGMAQGMAMAGLRPLVYIERADFLACCLSAITNHLDKCKQISRGEFNPCVLIRITVGNREKPLFTGPTHTSDPYDMLKACLRMPVYRLRTADEVHAAYEFAINDQRKNTCSSVLIDYKDLL